MSTNVEFTDRYDGRAPSWLRGCHGDCEATGVVPGEDLDAEWGLCSDCGGSGRVSWLVTLARIPRWLWKGARFIRKMGPRKDVRPPHMNAAQHWWLVFKCAYLYDLGWRQ